MTWASRNCAKNIPSGGIGRAMIREKRGRLGIDVPTLLYVGYIALFVGLMVLAGWMFGLSLVTFAFGLFIILVIVMIDYTSRIISES